MFEALPRHLKVAVGLMMYCGLDPQDAIRLPRTAIKDGHIDSRRGKTGEPVWIKLPVQLISILQDAPIHAAPTIAANSRGEPWTSSGFHSSWQKIKRRLEVEGKIAPGLTPKGLRHSIATILAEMGFDERCIADLLGQKTTEMARHYSKSADRSRKIDNIVVALDAELNKRRTRVVKPPGKLSNL